MAQGEVMVGVDVSMARLDVARWPGGESFSLSNDPAAHNSLTSRSSGPPLASITTDTVADRASNASAGRISDSSARALPVPVSENRAALLC